MKASFKKQILVIATVAATSLACANAVHATPITFDGLNGSGNGSAITNGYSGLNWTNFNVIDATQSSLTNTGYDNSGATNVAHDVLGYKATISSPTGFTLNSGDFTAAYANNLTIIATATLAGSGLNQSNTFTVSATKPTTLETFSFSGPVTSVSFSSFYGPSSSIAFPNNNAAKNIFAVDNLNITPVPEPETYGMMLAGLGLMGFMVRRKNSV
jgi:hypothetical protein